jgi:hypothetical protein
MQERHERLKLVLSINAINETAETWKGRPGVHRRRPIS